MSVGAEQAITVSSSSITQAASSPPVPGQALAAASQASAASPGAPSSAVISAAWQANLARLEGLAEVLVCRGLRAKIMSPPGRVPSLHVVNPLAGALAEDVYAGRGQDGLWWFWWSWADRIALSEDPEAAASKIVRVLAANG